MKIEDWKRVFLQGKSLAISGLMATFLVAASAGRMSAADLQLWNLTEVPVWQTARWQWDVFGVVRARDRVHDPYDARAGTLVRAAVTPRLTIGLGYLRRFVDPYRTGTFQENRLFLGPTILLVQKPVRLESLTLYERHFGLPDRTDFNRYKQRFEVEWFRRAVSPFLSEEGTFLQDGFVRSRTFAGLRWRQESGFRFEVGYQFESLKVNGAWVPRHSIRTGVALPALFKR